MNVVRVGIQGVIPHLQYLDFGKRPKDRNTFVDPETQIDTLFTRRHRGERRPFLATLKHGAGTIDFTWS